MRCFSGQPLSKINTAPKDKAMTFNLRTFSDPGLPATIGPRHPMSLWCSSLNLFCTMKPADRRGFSFDSSLFHPLE